MYSTKFLIVLCLGVLAVQAKPKVKNDAELKDQFDQVIREIENLKREAAAEQEQAIVRISGEVRSLDEISANILHTLGTDLQAELAQSLIVISALQERAYELGVDIRTCVGDSPDTLSNLSNQLLGEAGQCLNIGYIETEQAVEDGARKISEAISRVDDFSREVERCRSYRPAEQRTCLYELETEVRNARNQIPASINLTVEEVLGILATEKTALFQCSDRKLTRFVQEGGMIVRRVDECAERKFPQPPQPTPFK